MTRSQLTRGGRRLLDRLLQPSSAAGLAALLALLMPELAEHAPAIVDLALTVVAIGAANLLVDPQTYFALEVLQ